MVDSGRGHGRGRLWMIVLALAFTLAAWDNAAVGLTKKDLRRVSKEGPVEVSLVYLNPQENGDGSELSFEVRMNTHSVDLSAYEMEKLCFLRMDGGPEQEALGWFEPGGGGHHVSGVLKFAGPVPPDVKSLQVIVKDVGGVDKRVFEWKLPIE